MAIVEAGQEGGIQWGDSLNIRFENGSSFTNFAESEGNIKTLSTMSPNEDLPQGAMYRENLPERTCDDQNWNSLSSSDDESIRTGGRTPEHRQFRQFSMPNTPEFDMIPKCLQIAPMNEETWSERNMRPQSYDYGVAEPPPFCPSSTSMPVISSYDNNELHHHEQQHHHEQLHLDAHHQLQSPPNHPHYHQHQQNAHPNLPINHPHYHQQQQQQQHHVPTPQHSNHAHNGHGSVQTHAHGMHPNPHSLSHAHPHASHAHNGHPYGGPSHHSHTASQPDIHHNSHHSLNPHQHQGHHSHMPTPLSLQNQNNNHGLNPHASPHASHHPNGLQNLSSHHSPLGGHASHLMHPHTPHGGNPSLAHGLQNHAHMSPHLLAQQGMNPQNPGDYGQDTGTHLPLRSMHSSGTPPSHMGIHFPPSSESMGQLNHHHGMHKGCPPPRLNQHTMHHPSASIHMPHSNNAHVHHNNIAEQLDQMHGGGLGGRRDSGCGMTGASSVTAASWPSRPRRFSLEEDFSHPDLSRFSIEGDHGGPMTDALPQMTQQQNCYGSMISIEVDQNQNQHQRQRDFFCSSPHNRNQSCEHAFEFEYDDCKPCMRQGAELAKQTSSPSDCPCTPTNPPRRPQLPMTPTREEKVVRRRYDAATNKVVLDLDSGLQPPNKELPSCPAKWDPAMHGYYSKGEIMETEAVAELDRTTVMMKNIPNKYTQDSVMDLIHRRGFKASYDFLYLPIDFRSKSNMGYAFINFSTPEDAQRFVTSFTGFQDWQFNSVKVCEVTWSRPYQGLAAHIDRYRNSPTMHTSIPAEFKPAIFFAGQRLPFPPPTRPISSPKRKDGRSKDF